MAENVRPNPSDHVVLELLAAARSIALVGATSKNVSDPFGKQMQTLVDAGFNVIPVSRRDAEMFGRRGYASLDAIHERVDIVDVSDAASDLASLADDASRIGATTLWLQPGITNPDIVRHAAALGMTVVVDRDIVQAIADFGITHHSSTVPYDVVEEAGRESFPASDPPPWSRVRPGGPHDRSTDASP